MVGLFVATSATAQKRFDFATDVDRPGWQRVAPDTAYADAIGYGFEPDGGDGALFSVAIAEGDYRVTVWPASSAPLTVWAETRRLMRRATNAPVQFTVNVRQPGLQPVPANAPGGSAVRLNAREQGSRSWDDRLTLGFHGPVARIEIEPVTATRLILLGDSTVADQAGGDYASWGQMLPRFLDDGVSVANHAESGETLKSFLTGLRLDKALSQLRPGDVVLIQFGHNDSKAQWPQTYAEAGTTFRAYLRVYLEEVRRRGGSPVLVTSPHRRTFGADGRITNSHGGYPDAVRAVAREQSVPLIDLTMASARLYEALGAERARLAFANEGNDATHHNAYGAYILAAVIAEGLRDLDDPIAGHVTTDLHLLDLDNPPPPEQFDVRLIPARPIESPSGS
ncbi:rhamnogalacturonan acetylesterase [Brevundimonas sp. TWP2-3-4b1]|uniref:rhamnogalacturonan acetylesterase n=1 Tax=Brevundimonas sp. TWP2-3-4b1 TaxID=2804580 RepID=UPI003CFA8437